MARKTTQLDQQTLAYELVKERLAQQIESVNSLDIKASIVLAIIGVIFTGYLGLIDRLHNDWLRSVTLLILTLAGFFAVKTFVQTKRRRDGWDDWRNDPEPEQLLEIITDPDFDTYTEGEITSYILDSMARSYEHNKTLYRQRYNFLYSSLALVLLSVIIIGIQVILEV